MNDGWFFGMKMVSVMEELRRIREKEQDQVDFADDFENYFIYYNSPSVEDFEIKVNELLDEYIELSCSLRIVDELNRYVVDAESIKKDFSRRYGNRSKKYENINYIDSYLDAIVPKARNIWEVKKISRDVFSKILTIASQENKKLIQTPAMGYVALLRFYVTNLINKMAEAEESGAFKGIDYIKLAFDVATAIKEMELRLALHDEKIIEKVHSVGARMNKLKREQKKYEHIERLANEIWYFGCELLHTQLFNLFVKVGLIDEKDRIGASNILKKLAPENRTYGPGVSKIIDTCPCNKESGCPLLFKVSIKKRYSLPVAKYK